MLLNVPPLIVSIPAFSIARSGEEITPSSTTSVPLFTTALPVETTSPAPLSVRVAPLATVMLFEARSSLVPLATSRTVFFVTLMLATSVIFLETEITTVDSVEFVPETE